MPHRFEPASSRRAKCRGCARPIQRGDLRFGECIANPFGEGETALWFHPVCAAYKRPEPLLAALAEAPGVPDREALERLARASSAHRRLPRIDGAERAPSSQARCRCCHEPIERGTWRIRLVYFAEGRFSPGGTMHVACHRDYFEGHAVEDAVLHFSGDLSDEERDDLRRALTAS